MYKNHFCNTPSNSYKEYVRKIDEEISEELKKNKIDKRKILKLKEGQITDKLFDNDNINIRIGRFRSPW